jgi:predicted nucleic acid-binding protein
MASKPTYYWDACLFYEVLGDETVSPRKKAGVQQFLEVNKSGENVIATSVITHLEVIPAKLEAKKPGAAKQYLGMFDAVHFVEVEINRNILLRASEIREFYFRPADQANGSAQKVMDTADAIHLATAREARYLLSRSMTGAASTRYAGKYPLNIVSPEAAQGALDLDGKTETQAN